MGAVAMSYCFFLSVLALVVVVQHVQVVVVSVVLVYTLLEFLDHPVMQRLARFCGGAFWWSAALSVRWLPILANGRLFLCDL